MTPFTEQLFVGRPNIGNRQTFMRRVDDILDRRWLSNAGRYVREFEQRVADFLQVRHCIAMCNATVGLEIAIRALGLRGEVIIPSFTFIATAHALQWQEITPVFCDIEPTTHNIDPSQIEALITPRTTGILGVHLWGRACNIDSLEALASKHRLQLMFDASHAFGCTHEGKMIGGFGRAEVFSFHATKFVNTFEGGMVATNDDDLAAKMRLMKNFGFTGYDQVEYLGVNGKMNEISAAMGLTNLESIDAFIETNRNNYEVYRAELAGMPGVAIIEYDESESNNFQYIVAEIDSEACPISRDRLLQHLHDNNIIARRYFYPGCHRMEPYCSLFPNAGAVLPQTTKLADRVLVLPTGSAVSPDMVREVCLIIRAAVSAAKR